MTETREQRRARRIAEEIEGGAHENVTALRLGQGHSDPDAPPLVAWLRVQARSGLDEMFGSIPEKAYVRSVIEQHAQHWLKSDMASTSCDLWVDNDDKLLGCYVLFEIAVIYITNPGVSRRTPTEFDPEWLPPVMRKYLPH